MQGSDKVFYLFLDMTVDKLFLDMTVDCNLDK
jgi:hypothetical protein